MNALRLYPLGLFFVFAPLDATIFADDPPTPGPGLAGDRYESLWTKSPFAIATADAPAASDYQLVGIAQFDGISYASLIERQTQEHFVLASDKPFKNLTLVSITRGKGGSETSAVIQRNGESLTLTLEEAPAVTPSPTVQPMPLNMPGRPSPNPLVGGMTYSPISRGPPPVRLHRPPVNVPPPPGQ